MRLAVRRAAAANGTPQTEATAGNTHTHTHAHTHTRTHAHTHTHTRTRWPTSDWCCSTLPRQGTWRPANAEDCPARKWQVSRAPQHQRWRRHPGCLRFQLSKQATGTLMPHMQLPANALLPGATCRPLHAGSWWRVIVVVRASTDEMCALVLGGGHPTTRKSATCRRCDTHTHTHARQVLAHTSQRLDTRTDAATQLPQHAVGRPRATRTGRTHRGTSMHWPSPKLHTRFPQSKESSAATVQRPATRMQSTGDERVATTIDAPERGHTARS
jgi:hypothetical protein